MFKLINYEVQVSINNIQLVKNKAIAAEKQILFCFQL